MINLKVYSNDITSTISQLDEQKNDSGLYGTAVDLEP